MSKEIDELKMLIEHHKGVGKLWERKTEFLVNFIKENFGLTEAEIGEAWNQYVVKHWDDEQKTKAYKKNVIRLFPDGKGE
jgi:hypothetical protein